MDKVIHRDSKVMTILKDLLIAYIVTGLMLLIVAFFMLKLDISGGILSGLVIATYVLSAFVGGFLLGKNAEQKRFMWGLFMGALYFIVLILISILMDSFMGLEASRAINVFVICLFSGMLGGMVS
ncbi:hypothetical protein acsn021_10480 [Anaerocolumna cellulosilytica]|uniref:Uncharacterized protein n=1 Tax=Anaerocolumna cellulosilytica TaxID=433286 RepID=A0A6S6QWP2_9FIRM|nr:TIGR04086 family membrane protein [Anaerocolumna cellulosilytica]MBB5194535.1 putative membrane protein (TIGR04086 family) [Anaerocolumna cellulosilytica]BCJ93479.1 hypothetical protein acsn021_10480 [Anaerocolumna cellulosilytica]